MKNNKDYLELMNKNNTIGIIGVGSFTLDFAQRSADFGYKVLISATDCNHRIKNTAEKIGENVKISTIQETAALSDIIVLFLPKERLKEIITEMPDLSNKIIIHHNYLISSGIPISKDFYKNTAAQTLASLLPNSHIIKVYSLLESSGNSSKNKNDAKTLYYTTNNLQAGERVKNLLIILNFTVFNLLELSELNM
ncbi:NAD(P)-binding domain-containing protein [Flavobacterium artemisiae]|uniref:NAD(P)-binding domain-containing protein n=1 Tax=Flavobacterium artemisiae TaxID=2126556 RepID=UPI0036450BA6